MSNIFVKVAPGTSPTLTVLVSPKLNLSTFSSKVSLNSSVGNKTSKPARTLMPSGTLLPSQPNIELICTWLKSVNKQGYQPQLVILLHISVKIRTSAAQECKRLTYIVFH